MWPCGQRQDRASGTGGAGQVSGSEQEQHVNGTRAKDHRGKSMAYMGGIYVGRARGCAEGPTLQG